MQVLTFNDARHLVARTGLGAEWDVIKRLEGLPRRKAVEKVVSVTPWGLKPPPGMTPWYKMEPMRLQNAQGRKRAWMIAQKEGKHLQGWWIQQMLSTTTPFVERMTLFWHSLFTSSIQKTLQPSLLHKQNLMLREHALGNFGRMLHSIAKDPAMLVYLDGYMNVKDRPNENFARELLEMFTLGRGHYRESDVKAAAKAFTGWTVNNNNGQFVVDQSNHDRQKVTFMGKTGHFTGDAIINILLEQPRVAEHIAEKMWKAFINNNTPDRRVTIQWAKEFRNTNYDIRALMREVLNSEAFWKLQNRGTLVKSPIDILIGTVRMVPYPQETTEEMVNLCRLLGQELFDPPSVKGWSGGEHWITAQTLLVRTSYLTKVSRGNLNRRVKTGLDLPNAKPVDLVDWMLPLKPVKSLPTTPGNRRLVRSLLLDPVFQLT